MSTYWFPPILRYRNDIIHSGEVGGNCEKFYSTAILANLQHKSYLQSWWESLNFW